MAKDKLTDYSATNGSNTDIGGINIDEGMLPSAVNNSLRELMTHLKNFSDGTDAITGLKITESTADTNATLTIEAAGSGNSDADLKLLSDDTQSGRVRFFDGTGEGARIEYSHGGTNMTVQVEGSTRLRIDNTGDVKINDGNLVIGTAGHGIDFSATSNSAGSMTNELLSDYEEGTWTQ